MNARDKLAATLTAQHFDGTGCGDPGVGSCSNCYGPSPMSAREIADALIAEGWRKMPSDLTVERVERGGDFQSITFSNGSTIYGSSEQDAEGNWIDNRAIDAILALMDGGLA